MCVVRLLKELGVANLNNVTLNCDNQSALHKAQNPVFMRELSIWRLIVILREKNVGRAFATRLHAYSFSTS